MTIVYPVGSVMKPQTQDLPNRLDNLGVLSRFVPFKRRHQLSLVRLIL